MAYPILGTPNPQFLDSSGDPYASGTVTTHDSVGAVLSNYPTAADADANSNAVSGDITLDANGRISTGYWGKDGVSYKVIVKDVNAATILTMSDIRLPGKERRATVTFGGGDATPTVAEGSLFGTVAGTITDFDDGVVGDVIHLNGGAVTTFTDSGNIQCDLDLDGSIGIGDCISFAMFTDQAWHEIGRSINSASTLFETVTTTNIITQSENGKTFFLNSTTGFVSTLPAPALGLKFTFIIKTIPTSGNNTIVTTSSSNIMSGTVIDITQGASELLVYGTAQDVITFVQDGAIGDRVDLVSDGTLWYYTGRCGVDAKLTTGAT